jgi:hypothetical protein
MDVSKIHSSNEIYLQKLVEIIPISFQPVVVLEILLQRWSFGGILKLLSLSRCVCAAARTRGSHRISCSSSVHQVVEIWISS